ncbi:MAG: low molecular weight phosphatase family protein [Candidatus Pacearchaeota archaeon]
MKILFVCKHNRFRSKVAECIFNKLNKNPENWAESAGLLMDISRPYIEENVIKIMKEKGYDIKGAPRQLTKNLVKEFDVIVIVANNLEPEFFSDFKGKIIKWNIKDCDACDIKSIKEIIDEIEKKVTEFVNILLNN